MFGLSTELTTKDKLATVNKDIRVLTFRALALRQSESKFFLSKLLKIEFRVMKIAYVK